MKNKIALLALALSTNIQASFISNDIWQDNATGVLYDFFDGSANRITFPFVQFQGLPSESQFLNIIAERPLDNGAYWVANDAWTSQIPTTLFVNGLTGNTGFAVAQSSQLRYTILTEISPVPVPSATWLFGSGLIGLVGAARRKL